MFKNVVMYNITPGWEALVDAIEANLKAGYFVACSASQEQSVGWVEPRGEANGPLLESVAGHWILKLMFENRSVPASVINRKADERIAQIEASTGRKPGKKETRDIKDDLRLELLPMAFTKQSSVMVWVNREDQYVVMDTPSQARTDEVVTLLVQTLPGLALTLVTTQISPATAMADWLVTQEAPAGFSVDRECELKATDESNAVVRYTRHQLDTDEVKQHIEGGKMPTRLALTWNDRVSFVLTQDLQLKKLEFLDVVIDSAASGKDDGFDTDVVIATTELRTLLPDLLEALGGQADTRRNRGTPPSCDNPDQQAPA